MKTEFWKSIQRIFERFIKPFTGLVNKWFTGLDTSPVEALYSSC
jgi:hypothetical protein